MLTAWPAACQGPAGFPGFTPISELYTCGLKRQAEEPICTNMSTSAASNQRGQCSTTWQLAQLNPAPETARDMPSGSPVVLLKPIVPIIYLFGKRFLGARGGRGVISPCL